jgi:predicted O-methyltransferase YrrM
VSRERWSEVDALVGATLLGEDPALASALEASAAAELPPIAVSPPQGKLLHLIARIHGARTALELGTLGGYSTIWLARALPADGRLVTLELQPAYAEVARANIAAAGLSDRVEQRVGPALDGLRDLIAERAGPFDLIFIDADKPSTPEYFELALELSRAGGLIIVDNVVRDGAIADPDTTDAGAAGMRRLHELLARPLAGGRRVTATTIQTVGLKGYDGFTLALVEG